MVSPIGAILKVCLCLCYDKFCFGSRVRAIIGIGKWTIVQGLVSLVLQLNGWEVGCF